MLKILLWFISTDTNFLEDAIKTLERQHNGLEIVGSAVCEEINKVDVCGGYDVLLVVGAKNIGMSKIIQAAHQFNLPEEKILGDWIVCIPGFTLEKYRRLQRSRLSIFSRNCFGGIIYHTLGLTFRSPIINMFFSENDFIRFLRAPRVYMEEKLILKEMKWQTDLKFYYPVVTLGNVDIYMNHYPDFDEAVAKWNERKQRINWYNLFVMMSTENEEILQEFNALPYGKKVCFVPFKSNLDSAWYINPELKKNLRFWDIVNHFGEGEPFYYDPFDMLLYGKKTQLIDM